MKKVRKGRSKKKQEEAKLKEEMSDEEYEEYTKKRTTTSYKASAFNICWDFDKHQLSRSQSNWAIMKLNKRLDELNEKENPNQGEIDNIKRVINGIRDRG